MVDTAPRFFLLRDKVSQSKNTVCRKEGFFTATTEIYTLSLHDALPIYVLHVDLSPVRELVSLQRRCSNNLNQVAIQANTYGAIYPEELAALQRDYAALWGPLSDLLKQLSALVEL